MGDEAVHFRDLAFLFSSLLDLYSSLCQGALAYHCPYREPDQVCIGEFDAGAFVPVIEEDFASSGGQLLVEFFGGSQPFFAQADEVYLVGGQCSGPHQSPFIVVELGYGFGQVFGI